MSLLDIDERMLELAKHVEFDRSPITDIEHCGPCDIGLIEGGVCNSENVHVLREFRKNCKVLVAVGACAINGGLPAMRNHIPLEDCLKESYIDGLGVENAQIPSDPELPLLLDKVHPIHEQARHATSQHSGTPVTNIHSPTQRMGDALVALRPSQLRTKPCSVKTTSNGWTAFGMQFLPPSRATSALRISELPCRLPGTKNHHSA